MLATLDALTVSHSTIRITKMCIVLGCSLAEFRERFPLVTRLEMNGQHQADLTADRQGLLESVKSYEDRLLNEH
jgi:hypothetical protein